MEYKDRSALDNDLVNFKLTQARDSLEQARSLMTANMDLDLVANNVFYAMFYAVLALLNKRKVPVSTQNVTIDAFDREFVQTGMFDWRFSDALHKAFEIRSTCTCEDPDAVARKDIDDLLPLAEEFLLTAEHIIERI